MFKSNKLAFLAALLSLLMLVSMLAVVPAFAEDVTTAEETTVAETVEVTEPESSDETEAGTKAESSTEKGTEASTKKEEATTEEDTKEEAEKKKQQRTRGIINLVVGGVILAGLIVLIILYRAKIPGWWKGLKSECGKITWCPKDKLKKNVFVVVIIIPLEKTKSSTPMARAMTRMMITTTKVFFLSFSLGHQVILPHSDFRPFHQVGILAR